MPYLIRALESSKGWARVHALEVLGKIGDRSAVSPILMVLRSDPELEVRGIAARVLGAFGDQSVVPDLLKAGASGDSEVMRGAWFSLGELKAAMVIPLLVKNLGATVPAVPSLNEVRDDTPIDALVHIGDLSILSLASSLDNPIPDVREGAALALGRIGSKRSTRILMTELQSSGKRHEALKGILASSSKEAIPFAIESIADESLRMDALEYFERCPDARCISALEEAIAAEERQPDPSGWVFHLAASILHKLARRSTVPLLIHMLDAKLERTHAVYALGEIADTRAVPALMRILHGCTKENQFDSTVEAAGDAIANLGRSGFDALLDLAQKSPTHAFVVGKCLACFKDASLGPRMASIVSAKVDSRLQVGAIRALGNMKYVLASPLLIRLVESNDRDIRLSAVRSLARMGDARAIPPLYAIAAQIPRPELSEEWKGLGTKAIRELGRLTRKGDLVAAGALARIQNPTSTELLTRGVQSSDAPMAAFCASALGSRRSARTRRVLLEALNRPEIEIRFEAYMALRQLNR